jgi:hypothetical protein
MVHKAVMNVIGAIKIYEFEYEGEKLFCRDFSVSQGDECYAHLQSCIDNEGKVKTDAESIKEFQAYRNKFISYSLCDDEGKEIFSVEEIKNLPYEKIQLLFIAINNAKDGRKKTL